MDMTRQALEYIAEDLGAVQVHEIEGSTYVNKTLVRINNCLRAAELTMYSLTGLVDYIKSGTDTMHEKMLVQVVSPRKVSLISMLDMDRKRETLVDVVANLPEIIFGKYINHENFIIALQSKFIENEDRDLLLKFAGTVENGTVSQYGDDGVSQKATIKTGIASKGEAVVPNPVKLRPFRTFAEVEQPESSFIFRMRQEERSRVECAIFEADGGAWNMEAMKNIKEYLKFELSEYKNITVIS